MRVCIPKGDKPKEFIKKLEASLTDKYHLQNRIILDWQFMFKVLKAYGFGDNMLMDKHILQY